MERDDIPMWKHIKRYVTVVSVGTTTDAAVPIQVGNSKYNALIMCILEQNMKFERLNWPGGEV